MYGELFRRAAAHVEEISDGRVVLHLGDPGDPRDDTLSGSDGYAILDPLGRIQWIEEDVEAGTFRRLAMDSTTGGYVIPEHLGSEVEKKSR